MSSLKQKNAALDQAAPFCQTNRNGLGASLRCRVAYNLIQTKVPLQPGLFYFILLYHVCFVMTTSFVGLMVVLLSAQPIKLTISLK